MNDMYEELSRYSEVESDQSLANMTTLRIGGKANYTVYPENQVALDSIMRILKENDIPYKVIGKGSDLLMSMFPAEVSARAGKLRPSVTQAWEKDYHVTITVWRAEDIPAGAGGCWLRYSNVRTKSYGSESGLILFPEREALGFEPAGDHENLIYTPAASLAGLDLDNAIKFDFIRLDGVSYIYANGRFLFSYEDGFDGKMSFEGGAELYAGGNRVRCDYDDFSMRYR